MEAEALSLIIRARTHHSSRRTLSHWAGCVNILPTDPSDLNRGAYIIHNMMLWWLGDWSERFNPNTRIGDEQASCR